jgi:chorismate mutase
MTKPTSPNQFPHLRFPDQNYIDKSFFRSLIFSLIYVSMDKRILELRQQIDSLDEEIILLLKKRMGISKEVGDLKEELQIPVEDKGREQEIIDRLTKQAGRNLSEEQLIRIFTAVFKSSKQVQK